MTEISEKPFTPASFRQFLTESRLMASQCADCSELHLPPRAICPTCHGDHLEWRQLSGRGRLAAFTSIYIAPSAMSAAGYGREHPYLVAIVELEEGPKISARLLGLDAAQPEQITVGIPLQADFGPDAAEAITAGAMAFRPEE